MKRVLAILAVLIVAIWAYSSFVTTREETGAVREKPYSINAPRETMETFFQAVKKQDPVGIRMACEREEYGMNAMREIHSYETSGLHELAPFRSPPAKGTSTAFSAVLLGVDSEVVTTVHVEMKKMEAGWKITGLGTVGGTKKIRREGNPGEGNPADTDLAQ